jgi:hypothetical protein
MAASDPPLQLGSLEGERGYIRVAHGDMGGTNPWAGMVRR